MELFKYLHLRHLLPVIAGTGLIAICSAQNSIKIACVGSSITEGSGLPDSSTQGYVAVLQGLLGNDYDVRNCGKTTTTVLKNGNRPYWEDEKFDEVFSFQPDIITIMLGTNDSKPINWQYKEEFSVDLTAMVDTFATISTNPQIILCLPPAAGEWDNSISGTVIHYEVIPEILKVAQARDLDVIDVHTPFLSRLDLLPDAVHPMEEGNLLMADIFHEGIINLTTDQSPKTRLLWYGDAPGAMGNGDGDKPMLFIYPAPDSNANGAAVIICPGGGYGFLAMDHEGYQIAEWLNENGFTAFILRYRYSPYRHPIPLNDAKRAMRTVRYYVEDYGIDSTRIGVLGFSAGGHLASTLLTHYDVGNSESEDPIEQMKSRPDFGILVYPVITLSGEFAHIGSRNNLLGNNPDQELVDSLSNHLQITEDTPPTFMGHGDADNVVPLENSEMFDSALAANGVESELFVDPGKDHGYGLDGLWPDACIDWMKEQQIILTQVGVLNHGINNRVPWKARKVWAGHVNGKGAFPLAHQIYFIGISGQTEVPDRLQMIFDTKGKRVGGVELR
jgi:acetyl esterase/lipase